MELEALLLGLEPLTALTIGIGALAIAPVAGAIGSAMGSKSEAGNSLSESSRNLAKSGLVSVFDAFDKTQKVFAEAGESFQDLVAEARNDLNNSRSNEHTNGKSNGVDNSPHQVTIVSE